MSCRRPYGAASAANGADVLGKGGGFHACVAVWTCDELGVGDEDGRGCVADEQAFDGGYGGEDVGDCACGEEETVLVLRRGVLCDGFEKVVF
jgi:hypothetical protein